MSTSGVCVGGTEEERGVLVARGVACVDGVEVATTSRSVGSSSGATSGFETRLVE